MRCNLTALSRSGYHQGGKIQMKMVTTGKEKGANKENRDGKRR